jgi:hypothetical protein
MKKIEAIELFNRTESPTIKGSARRRPWIIFIASLLKNHRITAEQAAKWIEPAVKANQKKAKKKK